MSQKELLKVKNLKQYFPIKGGILGRTVNNVKAVDDISFTVHEGETVSVVGESGCGKSTTGRAILRLDNPTDGTVEFDGINLLDLNKKEMRKMRKDMQIIFQDPYASLNPRQTVRETLREAMAIQGVVPKEERADRIAELLETVGLQPYHADATHMNSLVDSVSVSGLPVHCLLIQNLSSVTRLFQHWTFLSRRKC